MKNKLFEEDKPFFLGYLVFGTFLKRWPDRLKVLQKRKEENPVIADEIDAAISMTEASMQKFQEAAEKYKAAAKNAKEQYDNQSGVKGKVKGFFGLEQGDPDKKIFELSEDGFMTGNVYSMNDILSPDFNIGLFLDTPLEGDDLKKEVMGNMLAFRKYYDPKTSSKISNEEIESLQDETLDTFDPFKVFNPTQQESLIKENEKLSGTMLEIKNICKPKAQQAFAKFQQSMKSNPTKVNLTKQSKLLINNPYYAIYRNFEGYDTGKKQIVGKFPEILTKVLIVIHDKLYAEPLDPQAPSELSGKVAEFVDGDFKNFDDGDNSIGDYLFGTPTKSQMASMDKAVDQEFKEMTPVFTKKAKEFIDNLQRVVPVFKIAEDENNPLKTVISINPVYNDNRSELHNFLSYKQLQLVKQIAQKTKPDFTGFNIEQLMNLVKKLKKAKRLRDSEVFLDLVNMKEKADLEKSKAMSKNLNTAIEQISNTKKVTDKNLQTYKRALEWLEKFKQQSLLTSNTNDRTELEEQITKLIKPYLRERIKSKRIGATK